MRVAGHGKVRNLDFVVEDTELLDRGNNDQGALKR